MVSGSTQKVRVIGQRSRSPGQKLCIFYLPSYISTSLIVSLFSVHQPTNLLALYHLNYRAYRCEIWVQGNRSKLRDGFTVINGPLLCMDCTCTGHRQHLLANAAVHRIFFNRNLFKNVENASFYLP